MPDPSPDSDLLLELGLMLGQRRAYTQVAGRCSAAHIEALRKIRDQKLFRPVAASWQDYCGPHLQISRRHADRLIALLEEFGPVYFELAQLTGITPADFRSIQPAVRAEGIQLNGEVIALHPDNASRVTEAIAAMLQRAPRRPPELPPDTFHLQLARLHTRGHSLAAAYERLLASGLRPKDRDQLLAALAQLRLTLGLIGYE